MLSSFLEEISSSGYLPRRASSPKRDSTGGVYSRLSAPNSHLPDGVPNPPCAKGKNGLVVGRQIEPDEVFAIQALQRDPVQEWMPGISSSVRIMSSSVSRKQASSKPIRSASARNVSTFDRASPGAGSAGRASGK